MPNFLELVVESCRNSSPSLALLSRYALVVESCYKFFHFWLNLVSCTFYSLKFLLILGGIASMFALTLLTLLQLLVSYCLNSPRVTYISPI